MRLRKKVCVCVRVWQRAIGRERLGVENAQPYAVAALIKHSSYTQHPHTLLVCWVRSSEEKQDLKWCLIDWPICKGEGSVAGPLDFTRLRRAACVPAWSIMVIISKYSTMITSVMLHSTPHTPSTKHPLTTQHSIQMAFLFMACSVTLKSERSYMAAVFGLKLTGD